MAHLGLLCLLAGVATALPTDRFGRELPVAGSLHKASTFRLLTLNVAEYDDHKNWTQRLTVMAEQIAEAQPDIIALQEVRLNPDEETSSVLYQHMGEELLFELQTTHSTYENASIHTTPAMYYSGLNTTARYPIPASQSPIHKPGRWEGLAVISKCSIPEAGSLQLSKTDECKDHNLRASEFTRVQCPDFSLALFNTHFGLDDQCLNDNIRETVEWMGRITPSLPGSPPAVLVGDFNSLPDNSALDKLVAAGYTDLWTVGGEGDGKTFPSRGPTKRIDYAFAGDTLKAQLANATLFGTKPSDEGVFLSDHFGVMFEFNL